ncbi:V-type ATPase subunit family protein [Teladorsagia circumcincta]|uniref:V-type proton ATPase subunit a n=1 Tax=Teladorsagia circumcincta TaxID=45464 RepID=A0A2G9UIU7_TELCI|nr:V-type ATPase subunit family protein [Teladorsagia circumcincta]
MEVISSYVVGVIRRERLLVFERVLWRASHHTAYLRSAPIEEDLEDENKDVFIVFYKGDRLRSIVEKVCDGFKAKLMKNCPKTFKDRQSARIDVKARLQDVKTVLGQTQEHRFGVRMQKTVYHHLNLFTFDGIGKFFVAECWVPLVHLDEVKAALERGAEISGSTVQPVLNVLESPEEPPTYNRTNKFTEVFQGIVDSYGIATYQELNPGKTAEHPTGNFQIIVKWIFFWVRAETIFGQLYPGSHCAPSLLPIAGTNGTTIQYVEQEQCYLTQWYPGQSGVEAILVIIAVLCVPVMLFGKPIYFIMEQRKKKKAMGSNISVRANVVADDSEIIINGNHKVNEAEAAGAHGHDEAFGDVMVHQAIHTIEYVLGCVSHTASYLRLWALSLAHAQLSEVLWHMVLSNAFGLSGIAGYIAIYVIFFFFGVLTFSILVLMEGLSAFLHALRLHWVEFQSKFYQGLGYAFVPYSFKTALLAAEAGN